MTILVLGGTAEARRMAKHLHHIGLNVTYSIAGLVRAPNLDCVVISGGFTQFGGLSKYILDSKIKAILDLTHPYAENISQQAIDAARHRQIPCWRYTRPPWQAIEGDKWQVFDNWAALLPLLSSSQSVFFTTGQLEEDLVSQLGQLKFNQLIVRTAVKSGLDLPEQIIWIKGIGPFDFESELALLKQYNIDALVCKNSGGDATEAKLVAARQLGIRVFLYKRPFIAPADKNFDSIDLFAEYVTDYCSSQNLLCQSNSK